ncbi:MAG: response regulator [Candidatus Limnocylindria bacterium]
MSPDERPRISVINDNPEFLELMSVILDENAGYDVTLHGEEKTSIADLRATDPDLLIVDLLLGGASGWEIVTLARADETLASCPIIVCSADAQQLRERAEELAQIGNVHVLTKPFGIDELTVLVDHLLTGDSGDSAGAASAASAR